MRATVLTAGPGPAADAAARLAAALGDTPDLVVVGTAVSDGAPDPAVVRVWPGPTCATPSSSW
ncbi:MAG: hypothetical protein EKK42_25325 [Pseudonocardiaceae bacterium]|nr:MAG: hypothetical protein EKK42_25325 [Pseudonocardiaceae bacterium]